MEFLCSGAFLTTARTLLADFLYIVFGKTKKETFKIKTKQNKTKNEIISDGWYIFLINFLIILCTD